MDLHPAVQIAHTPSWGRTVNKQIGYDSQNKRYWVCNDTFYHWDTPDEVIQILEDCRKAGRSWRIEIAYGDTTTGLGWGDINCGYIGRSTGTVKIPLLIYNSRSMGGPGLLEHCIVRIRMSQGKRVLYQHPRYHTDETWADKHLAKHPQLWNVFIRAEDWLMDHLQRYIGGKDE